MLELLMAVNVMATGGVVGQVQWTVPGTYQWTVPEGVTEVSVLLVGAGSHGRVVNSGCYGGLGGAVRWKNKIAVTPGQVIPIVVGDPGEDEIISAAFILGNENSMALRSTAFDLYSGDGSNATIISTNMGGGRGGTYDTRGPYTHFTVGGSAGGLTKDGLTGSTVDGAGVGIDITTGLPIRPSTPARTGANAGGGGTAEKPAGNTLGMNRTWRGGYGAVRIIWGRGRAYPDKGIKDM